MSNKMPTYFISHGGGPWPWIPSMAQALAPLAEAFRRMPSEIGRKPKAVLMISGHWEKDDFAVMTSANPPMVYDYYNFPPETYEISYPAPGAPELALRVHELLKEAGLPTSLDPKMGFDHGAFVPMAVIYPDADVPLFQVSMRKNYSPEEHFKMGQALAKLRDEDILIVGSGLSYHNLRLFGPGAKEPSEVFDAWLTKVLALPEDDRKEALMNWEDAPFARVCHAREDHLVPLFAVLGAAGGDKAQTVYHQKDIFGGVTASSFRFG